MDLSWPKGSSVNDAVESDTYVGVNFLLTLPTIDNITDTVKKLGRGCHIAKIDISWAFKHVPIDPADTHLLGLNWKGAYYLEKNLVFGFKFGSMIFQRLSQSVRYIMSKQNYIMHSYIDDHLLFGQKSDCQKAFDRLHGLLQELGFTISEHKNVLPTTLAICLGIEIDTKKFCVSLPDKKLNQIKDWVQEWSYKEKCTKNQLQSLLGSLLYVSKCVKYSRFFSKQITTNFKRTRY